MKNEKKHIDRLFQEGLKNFEATPSHAVWENISEQLLNNKKERKVIPLWLKVSAIAAGLLLLITLGNSLFFQDNSTDPKINETIVDTESQNEQNTNNPDNSLDPNNNIDTEYLVQEDSNDGNETNDSSKSEPNNSKNTIVNNTETVVAQNDRNSASDNNTLNPINKKDLAKDATNSKVASNPTSEKVKQVDNLEKNPLKEELSKSTDINSAVAKVDNADENKIDDKEVNKVGKLSIEDAIAKNDEENTQETKLAKDKMTDRWSVAPNVAPVYFNSLGTGSSIDKEFVSNTKSGEINMSYGVSASYALNDKINVRVGVNNVKLGFKTHDAFDARSMSGPLKKADVISTIILDEIPPQLAFVTVSGMSFAQVPEALNNQYDASIDQKLGFIEVPLEMEYELSDKRLGLRVLGGFSALFLNENEVFSTLNNETTLIGEATNINKTSFSANFGVGLDFNLTEKFRFNIEPTFKYQLNTFKNTSGNFKPYFVGVYSGFSFKF